MGDFSMKNPKTNVSLWVKPHVLDRLDKIVDKFDLKRSQLIINLINLGFDAIKKQDNLGIIKLILVLKKYTSKINMLLNAAEDQILCNEEDQRGKNLSVRINSNLVQEIDLFAKKMDMSRSTFIEYLLENPIRNISVLDFIHMTDAVMLIDEFNIQVKKSWKQLINDSRKALKTGKVVTHKNDTRI